MSTALSRAARRVDDRRRAIESEILADMELHLLCDPAPAGDLHTERHEAAFPPAGTCNASSFQVVVWGA